MDRLAAELGQKFKLKDMDDAGYYMGCHNTSNRKARALKLDQHLYVELMVKRFDVKEVTKIPAASGVPTLSKVDEPRNPEEKEEIRKLPYREAVAALMWTATMTRPDIACAVRAVARFCENPGPVHKKAVVKILKYLLHTKEWGLRTVDRAVDSAWKQTRTRISEPAWIRDDQFRVLLMLANEANSWHSKMQEVTVSSTSDAEYVVLSEVVKEVLLLRQVQEFMEPLMRVGAVNVFEDNGGGIKLATHKQAC